MAASHQIIERLNTHLGEGHVQRIRIVQAKMTQSAASRPKRGLSPRQQNQLQDSLSNIEKSDLKQALEKLGRGVLTNDS